MWRPVAAAMWWVGPASLQRLQNSRAPQLKRVRMLVSPKVKMGAGFIDALGNHKLEVAVLVLRDGQIGHIANRWIELGQIAATSLAVEHGHDLHGRLFCLGDIGITGAGMADDADDPR